MEPALAGCSEVYEPQVQVRAAIALAVAVAGFVLLWAAGALSRERIACAWAGSRSRRRCCWRAPLGVLLWRLGWIFRVRWIPPVACGLWRCCLFFERHGGDLPARLWSRELRRALSRFAARRSCRAPRATLDQRCSDPGGQLGVALGVLPTGCMRCRSAAAAGRVALCYLVRRSTTNGIPIGVRTRPRCQRRRSGSPGRDRAVLPDNDPAGDQLWLPSPTRTCFRRDRKFNDMDLRVTARRIAGPDDNQFGVVFRYGTLTTITPF